MQHPLDPSCFAEHVLANPNNRAILQRWDRLALPDGWLVAGCLFQTVWNLQAGADPAARIKDYDLFYFDGADLGAEAQAAVQQRAQAAVADLGIEVEAVNQARVHLWYPRVFGHDYPALHGAREGIARFLVLATCVGVRPDGRGGLEVCAPYGLQALYDGVLAPNPLVDRGDLFARKAASYRARWPWLRTVRAGETTP